MIVRHGLRASAIAALLVVLHAGVARGQQDAPRPRPEDPLARDDALEDLDWLAASLRDHYSYWHRGGTAFEERMDQIVDALPERGTLADHALRVQELLCLLGDGHTQLEGFDAFVPDRWLPFLVEEAGGRFYAIESDRSRFVDDDHRELVALDGKPVAEWLAAAKRWVARGHEAFERREAMRGLRRVGLLRRELGLPDGDRLEVTLAGKGGRKKERTLQVSSRKPIYGTWPRTKTRELDGGVGYLRLESMDDEPAFLQRLRAELDSFATAKGLVIDVRGNGGGSRDALRELLPRLMDGKEPLAIVNVGARRIAPGDPADGRDGSLEDRFLYPATSRVWSGAEQKLVERFLEKFEPAHPLPERDFTAWHVMGVRPELPADAKRLRMRVVVLQDGGCFSATDIFLAALKGRPGVTTLGTISGGGSGRARRAALPRSGLELRASTMASFRPDGSPYDGAGIAPDVVVEPAPDDLIGKGDAQLDAALKELKKKGRR